MRQREHPFPSSSVECEVPCEWAQKRASWLVAKRKDNATARIALPFRIEEGGRRSGHYAHGQQYCAVVQEPCAQDKAAEKRRVMDPRMVAHSAFQCALENVFAPSCSPSLLFSRTDEV